MKVLKVLNVRHGDSVILQPSDECYHSGKVIMVDLGTGRFDVTQQIEKNKKVHLFITHHDSDHLGGIKYFVGKMDTLEEITVPFYQNEITLIAKCILKLKGLQDARDCGGFVKLLEEIVDNQLFIKRMIEGNRAYSIRLSFAYEGKAFCNHLECMNPPKKIQMEEWIGDDKMIATLNEIFEHDFAKQLRVYFESAMNGAINNNIHQIFELLLNDSQDIGNEGEIIRKKANFVASFIMEQAHRLKRFNQNPTRANFKAIYREYTCCAHDVCTVLKANYCNRKILLTGDASKKVFLRLIKEKKDLTADYIKMPHHGSEKNINQSILKEINASVAIISHNNRRFGTAKDTLPNRKTIEILEKQGMKILITNDVIKNGVVVLDKRTHCSDEYVEIE